MATINAPANDRRHIPERRTSSMVKKGGLSAVDWIASILMIVGGLNWALVGLIDFNLVAALFGDQTPLTRIIYTVVGLAALYGIYMLSKLAARKT